MTFDFFIPHNLGFSDYIWIIQLARTWADGYDQKDAKRLRAILAPVVEVDYSRVSTTIVNKSYEREDLIANFLSPDLLGRKCMLTQHFLGQAYFVSVLPEEITVQFQQIAGHGRWNEDPANLKRSVDVTSDGKSYIEHRYIKLEGAWKLAGLKPSLLYEYGSYIDVIAPISKTEK